MPEDPDDWVERVFGVRPAGSQPSQPAVEQTKTLSGVERPTAPPSSPSTEALVATARKLKLPDEDEALPEALTAHAARFVTAIVDEPCMRDAPLATGERLPAADQMVGMADQLDAVARSMQVWTACVEQAEAARDALTGAQKGDAPDMDAVAKALDDYNDLREDVQAAQGRTLAMLKSLRAASAGLGDAAGQAG